ncbi:MAG TPA: hypothetical protein PL033_14445 [Candidatus Brocadiia bacterium]|nr:hypothetical protein [Candidatus Brocadiia bacterium]
MEEAGQTPPGSGSVLSEQDRRKLERLALIKERYRKLVLEPRRQIQFEIESESEDKDSEDGSATPDAV